MTNDTNMRIVSLIVGVFLLCISSLGYAKKTNVVIIIADDVGWNDLGCYGNDVVKTPNIDQLANGGMLFNNAFLTSSSCSPSRCSIISGKYPHSCGAPELHVPLPKGVTTLPLLLKNSGYYTAQAGKWHFGENVYSAFDRYTDKNGYNNGNGGEKQWVRFIKERPKDKPFFFWLAAHDAHRPWGANSFHVSHDAKDVEVPVYFVDTPATRADMVSYYNEISRFDHYIGKVVEELKRQKVYENTLIIVMADNGSPFPRCKTRVYDSGMKTPFVVHWPKKIKRAAECNSLISSIDIAPTVLDIAGIKTPADFQGVSMMPLIKNPKATVRDKVFAEHNWHDYEAHERMVRTKEYMYVLNSRPLLSNCGPADSKRSATQKALDKYRDMGVLTAAQADIYVTPRPVEELFNVIEDSLQLVNIASSPKYKQILEQMRADMKKWQKETLDSTPDSITKDWYNRETGGRLDVDRVRGILPGSSK